MAAFLAVLPLLVQGPSCGHDFDFHLLSWLEAATQYLHGGYPHWAFTPAYNAGEPRFLFYPPLSWTLGALLTLVFPVQYAGAAFIFVALTLSGFTAHRLARRYAPPATALLCATLYLANPYMLFTAYERSAFAELLAAAWLPLLFLAALAPRPRVMQYAVPVALLWLTNAPAAVMGCYALAILTLLRLLQTREGSSSHFRLALVTLAGTALGLLLPAFYLLPAAYERRYVQIAMATIEGMRPQDHFLFHRMAGQTPDDLFHDTVVRTASLVALLILVAIALLFLGHALSIWPKRSAAERPAFRRVTTTTAPLAALIAFLLTPPSLFLWHRTPQLMFLQFPWRLTALLAVILLLAAATSLRVSRVWLAPLLAAALILPAYRLFHQPCDVTDTPAARAALFHSNLGTEPTDEYTPAEADNDALHQQTPAWSFQCTGADFIWTSRPGQVPLQLQAELPCDATVLLNRRAYPDWALFVNGQNVTASELPRDDGLIAFPQSRGRMSVSLHYVRTTDQKAGLLVSGLALLALLFAWRQRAWITLSKSKFT